MFKRSTSSDRMLHDCLQAMAEQGWTVEECLTHYPEQAPRLEAMLRTARRLQASGPTVHPPTPTRRQAWQSHVAEAQQQAILPFARPRWRWVALTALLVVLLALGLPTGISRADSAAPGDPLFTLDTAIEQLQLQLATPERALDLRIAFAGERLAEAGQLITQEDLPHADLALDLYDQLVDEAGASLEAGQATADEAQLAELDDTLSHHEARLQELLTQVPEPGQRGIQRALEASQKGRERIGKEKAKQHTTGKPADTPGLGPGDKGKGNQTVSCPDGDAIRKPDQKKLEKLARRYDAAFEDVLARYCGGLSLDEIEAQLAGDQL